MNSRLRYMLRGEVVTRTIHFSNFISSFDENLGREKYDRECGD